MHEKINESETQKIRAGSYVEVAFDDGEALKLYVVEERDVEYDNTEYDQVSTDSPIGRAILSRAVGDTVTYTTPSKATLTLVITSVN